jgi:hypothetical protein
MASEDALAQVPNGAAVNLGGLEKSKNVAGSGENRWTLSDASKRKAAEPTVHLHEITVETFKQLKGNQ